MLLRNALGETLRNARTDQNRTLRDVSTAANVSLGYLSEVERGRKEASSELLAAICHALDLRLSDVMAAVSHNLRTDAANKAAVVRNSAKVGLPPVAPKIRIDPSLRIVLPYTMNRPQASLT